MTDNVQKEIADLKAELAVSQYVTQQLLVQQKELQKLVNQLLSENRILSHQQADILEKFDKHLSKPARAARPTFSLSHARFFPNLPNRSAEAPDSESLKNVDVARPRNS